MSEKIVYTEKNNDAKIIKFMVKTKNHTNGFHNIRLLVENR